jgi:hypothetical protein
LQLSFAPRGALIFLDPSIITTTQPFAPYALTLRLCEIGFSRKGAKLKRKAQKES